MSISRKAHKLASFAGKHEDPAKILIRFITTSKTAYDLAVPLMALELLQIEFKDYPSTPLWDQARATVRVIMGQGGYVCEAEPDSGRTPKGMITNYDIIPPADSIHDQRRAWNEKHGISYVGDRFVPKSENLRPKRYSEELPDIWRV